MGSIGAHGRVDPELHHPDGTHRSTANSANGAVLDRFERKMAAHLHRHEEEEEGK